MFDILSYKFYVNNIYFNKDFCRNKYKYLIIYSIDPYPTEPQQTQISKYHFRFTSINCKFMYSLCITQQKIINFNFVSNSIKKYKMKSPLDKIKQILKSSPIKFYYVLFI